MSSFTWRLTFRFAALVTITTATVLAIGGWLLDRQMLRRLELLHEVEFEEVRQIFSGTAPPTAEELIARMRAEAESDAVLYYFQFNHTGGGLLFRSPNLGEAALPNLPAGASHHTITLPGIGPLLVSEFQSGPWRVHIGSDVKASRQLLRDYAQVAGVLLFGVMVASVGLGYGFSRYTLRPVRAIEQTARRIRGDNLGERIAQPAGRDELADLVRLLNQMFERLETSFIQVRRFTSNASHELKTPLALVRLNAEKLRTRVAGDPEASEMVDEINEDLDALRQITESLLFLAKAESGTFSPALVDTDVERLVREFAEDATAMAEERAVIFNVTKNDPGTVRCEPTLVRQVLMNLLTNALRVAPRGSSIVLESTLASGRWRLAMTDAGPGLPEEQLQRVFERFVRFGEPSTMPGHGLGLAICRSIAGLHGGTINATNGQGRRGLHVVVELPHSEERL